MTDEWAKAAGNRQIISQINARLGDVSFSNIQDLFGEATNSSPNTILSQSAVRSWTTFLDFSLWKLILQDGHNFPYRLCTKGGFWELQRDIPIDLTLETVLKMMVEEWLECFIDSVDSPTFVDSRRKLARAVRFTRGLPTALRKVLRRDALMDHLSEHIRDRGVQMTVPFAKRNYHA